MTGSNKRRRDAAYRLGFEKGRNEAHALLERLSKWDRDFPVNCWNGYAGLKELDRIIAEARTILGEGKELPL